MSATCELRFAMYRPKRPEYYAVRVMNCVLVVDDEPAIRNLERVILRSAGYHVLTASNGAEALEVLENAQPSIVVMDLQMPVMDGRSFFKELSARKGRPAVLVVSSNGARRAQVELGAEASLEKPFMPDDFLDRIEQLQPGAPLSHC